MAHSFVSFKGNDARIHDLDLAVTCLFMIDEAARGVSDFTEFDSMFAAWIESLREGGAGCIDLQLDTYLATPSDVKRLADLIAKTSERLASYGASIPAVEVNSIARASGTRLTNPYKAQLIQDTLKSIATLLSATDETL